MRNLHVLKVLAFFLTLTVLLSGCTQILQGDRRPSSPVQSQSTGTNPSENPSDPTNPSLPSDPTESTAPSDIPTEPASTDPAPTSPNVTNPTEPNGTEPAPTEPKPTEPQPTEPKPTEPQPTEPKPTEPQPTEPQPTEPQPTEPQPTEPQPPAEEEQPALEMQGLKALKAQAQAANLVEAYQRIANGVENAAESVDLQGLQLTPDMLNMVFSCYRNDYPQHFWLKGNFQYSYRDNIVTALSPQYHLTGSQLTAARAQFDRAVSEVLSLVNSGMTAYEKELTIHDALLNRCQYQSGSYPHSAYGPLVEGKAVCEGYARAFQYLMHRVGISCMVVSGTGHGEAHAWNAVQIGKSWYYTDVTWDDPVGGDGTIYYAYFNLTRAAMDLDHVAQQEYIPMPAATSTLYNYHVRNGSYTERYDQSQLARLLSRSNTVRVYVAGNTDAYIQSLRDNISAILAEAGIRDCTGFSYRVCGREIIITINRGA